jgi:hypothetical protein
MDPTAGEVGRKVQTASHPLLEYDQSGKVDARVGSMPVLASHSWGKGLVLTKQVSPLEMCPASRAGEIARGMIEQMPLQMLCPRETPATSIILANKSLLSVLA